MTRSQRTAAQLHDGHARSARPHRPWFGSSVWGFYCPYPRRHSRKTLTGGLAGTGDGKQFRAADRKWITYARRKRRVRGLVARCLIASPIELGPGVEAADVQGHRRARHKDWI